MPRLLALALLSACHTTAVSGPDAGPAETVCPTEQDSSFGDMVAGSPCTGSGTCFVVNTFSSCASSFYRCESGVFEVDHGLGAGDGRACTGSPLASCTFEGNDCSSEPTAQFCSCGADGSWHCTCRCYDDTRADCPSCPATFDPNVANSAIGCGPSGTVCPYPGGHSCTCGTDGHFTCQ